MAIHGSSCRKLTRTDVHRLAKRFPTDHTECSMAFLDFIRNREAQQSAVRPAEQQKPETAKQMYSREAAQEKVAGQPMRLSPQTQAKVDEIKATLQSATRDLGSSGPAAPSTADGATNPQPMAQNMLAQSKQVPALTPTSAQAGTPSTGKDAPAQMQGPSVKAPERSGREQTMPRTTPSWER